MSLFASLGGDATASCSVPTAIQLHSDHALDFMTNKISTTSKASEAQTNKHSHSILSYQAIQTQQDEEERTHIKPDLGVWNCCTTNNFDDAALGSMLKKVVLHSGVHENAEVDEKKDDTTKDTTEAAADCAADISTNTVVMTVHLDELNTVQPTLERMKNVLVHSYGDDKITGKGTTSIKILQSCTFGKCEIKQEMNPSKSGGIALILAVIVPSSRTDRNASTEYQMRQQQSFVVYHLHKFALETNCTLCFVREGENVEENMSTMTIEELASVIRRVAMGFAPVDEVAFNSVIEEEQTEASDTLATTVNPAIYPAGSHDAELISGAMQRNASCEGLWDASNDDLIVALPPPSTTTSENTDKHTKHGDEEWLSKLASSVGITIDSKDTVSSAVAETTPVERKKEPKKKKSTRATSKSEKDPSDFFANLLKK